ncbi:hypothetical protein [Chenggangzhangella methanolivorans]|uniref:Secreted protein n=1 Tax=Chenggangzhangella methanolivorans TaxID=1437009 RepID=A0A9E6R8I2_9HYPH|nr:hypothetical protein [Chenggangzhangella methanolivorans]QZN99264.1 hypothetical protein K6K41_21070 [Chenggangzhangella methanolivorans]
MKALWATALAIALAVAPGAAKAGDAFTCGKGPGFEVLTPRTEMGWPDRIEVKISGQPKQVLIIDKETPERAYWENEAWGVYSFKLFVSLTDKKRKKDFDCR